MTRPRSEWIRSVAAIGRSVVVVFAAMLLLRVELWFAPWLKYGDRLYVHRAVYFAVVTLALLAASTNLARSVKTSMRRFVIVGAVAGFVGSFASMIAGPVVEYDNGFERILNSLHRAGGLSILVYAPIAMISSVVGAAAGALAAAFHVASGSSDGPSGPR